MTQEELYSNPDFVADGLNIYLYNVLIYWMDTNNVPKDQLCDRLQISKTMRDKMLSGNFNFSLNTIVRIGLIIGYKFNGA